jgi:hypothetical protein
MRLCRLPCGKPLAFRTPLSKGEASLSGIAAKMVPGLDGKPEAFRTEGGIAARLLPISDSLTQTTFPVLISKGPLPNCRLPLFNVQTPLP